MSLFGKKEKAQIRDLKDQLVTAQHKLYGAQQEIQRLVQTVSNTFAYTKAIVEKYEKGRIGARPCLLGVKGYIYGLMGEAPAGKEDTQEKEVIAEDESKA